MGTICPRVKIRGHGNPHQLASPRAPPPTRTVHRAETPAAQHLCVWRSLPHQVLLTRSFSWPGGERAGLWEQKVKAKKGYEMRLSISTRPRRVPGYRALSLGLAGAGSLFWSSAGKGSGLGEAALARGPVSGCRTQPREQAVQDTALLDGLLHHEPVLARLPGGRLACVGGRHLVQDPQLGNLLPHLCPVVVVPGHLRGGGCGRPGSGGPFRPALSCGGLPPGPLWAGQGS